MNRRASNRPNLLVITIALVQVGVARADPPRNALTLAADTLDDRTVDMSAAADRKRDEAIKALIPLVSTAGPDQKAELVFRLAELYWAKSRSLHSTEMAAHDASYATWLAEGQRGPPPAVEDFIRESKVYSKNTLSLYRRVLDIDAAYARNDEVLFYLAQAAETAGRLDEAAADRRALIRRFPKSRFVPATWLRLGEQHFAANRLVPARRAYQRAVVGDDEMTRRYARYKLAWCDFNAQEYSAGIAKLQQVVRERGSADGRADVASEALRDLTLFFAYAGNVAEAVVYFGRNAAPKDATQLISRFAAQLDDQGKWASAVAARRRLLERLGVGPASVAVRVALIASLVETEEYAAIASEAAKLPANELGHESILDSLYATGTRLHRRAMDKNRPDQLRATASVYSALLTLAGERSFVGEVRFFSAEVLMALGDYRRAAKDYDRVANDHSGRYRTEAAMGAVLAYEKIGTPVDGANQPLIRACDRYAALAPIANDAPEVMMRAAQEFDRVGNHQEAARRIIEVVRAHPKSSLARRGAHGVVNRLVVAKRWADVDQLGRRLLAVLGKDEVLHRAVEGARYKSLQEKEKTARALTGSAQELAMVEIADGFARFQQDFPRSPFADEALMSAALLSARVGRIDRALRASSLLAERYAQSEHSARNYLLYAELHERIADFRTAARMFEQFATDHSRHARAPEALVRSGRHYEHLQEAQAARRVLRRFLERHATNAEAPAVYLRLCSTYTPKRAARCYGGLSKKWPRAQVTQLVEAKAKQASALADANETRRSLAIQKWLVERWPTWTPEARKDDRVRVATAVAGFALAEVEYERLKAVEVKDDARWLERKLTLLDGLVCAPTVSMCKKPGRLVEVIRLGDPDLAIAALTRIGDSYRDTHDSMASAPMPAHLSPEQTEIYRSMLMEQMTAMSHRALEAYELVAKRAHELGVYSEWVIHATTQLHYANAERWPERQLRPIDRVDELLLAPIRQVWNATTSDP